MLEAAAGPEALLVRETELSPPGAGELRIRQTAIGVNYHDIYVRSGPYRTLSLPGIPDGLGAGGSAGAKRALSVLRSEFDRDLALLGTTDIAANNLPPSASVKGPNDMAIYVITGCSSGFGEAIALAFAARGDTVIATMRNPGAAPEGAEAHGELLKAA